MGQKITFRFIIKIIIALCILSYFMISLYRKRIRVNINKWVHPRCNCSKDIGNPKSGVIVNSTCPYADIRGPHQNVLSYSFYGNTNSKYFKGIPINAEGIATHYPGWTMRLYHNTDPTDASAMSILCREVWRFPHLDDCYVGDVANQFRNISTKPGVLWRFLVLGDPAVDIFNVRDIDSPILQREVDAVNDWLNTNKTWHIMRDHPQHTNTILAGMWGARNYMKNTSEMRSIVNTVLDQAVEHYYQVDQVLLDKILWPVAKLDMVSHDSFLCQVYPGTKAWPSPRVNALFVGRNGYLVINDECPLECRPKDHPDWIHC